MFYGYNWDEYTIDEFIQEVDDYMHWYREERIKATLGGLSPHAPSSSCYLAGIKQMISHFIGVVKLVEEPQNDNYSAKDNTSRKEDDRRKVA